MELTALPHTRSRLEMVDVAATVNSSRPATQAGVAELRAALASRTVAV